MARTPFCYLPLSHYHDVDPLLSISVSISGLSSHPLFTFLPSSLQTLHAFISLCLDGHSPAGNLLLAVSRCCGPCTTFSQSVCTTTPLQLNVPLCFLQQHFVECCIDLPSKKCRGLSPSPPESHNCNTTLSRHSWSSPSPSPNPS